MDSGKLVFDIETGGLPEEQIEVPEFEAPSNYKTPEAIAKYVEKKKQDYIEKAAISCFTGEVLAIGFQYDNKPVEMLYDMPESEMIEQFWNVVNRLETYSVVGWNSNGFDLPFMIRKSWKYGIRIPDDMFTPYGKFSNRYIDLMLNWGCGVKEYVKLDTVAKFFGIGAKNGDGKFFKDMYKNNKTAALKYLENDVLITKAVAEKML